MNRRDSGDMVTGHGSRVAFLGVFLLLTSGCAAAGAYSATSAGPPKPIREVLPNGVVLIVQEHRASDVVAVQLWMRMGGRDEAPDELGLAHYIEHMIFKGTRTRPPGSIDRMIEGFGGTSNAFTSYDTTHYDFVVPVKHLRATVELLADLAVNASFPPDEIESEKKVVFEEMNLVEDDPDKFLLRRLYEVAYSPHPYGRQILGTHEFIERLRRDRLLAFYRKYFVPKNMVVVVIGAVKPAEVRSAVAAAFGKIPSRPGGRPELPPPPAIDARRPGRRLGGSGRSSPRSPRTRSTSRRRRGSRRPTGRPRPPGHSRTRSPTSGGYARSRLRRPRPSRASTSATTTTRACVSFRRGPRSEAAVVPPGAPRSRRPAGRRRPRSPVRGRRPDPPRAARQRPDGHRA